MSHQEAFAITGALETLGVIEVVNKGKAGVNSRNAAEFRYLLPEIGNGRPQVQNERECSNDGKRQLADNCPF
jgi:hypothetical protein